jgi:diaminopimelate decarboxylase
MHRLPALVRPAAARFIADVDAMEAVVSRFGSPVNVLLPDVFAANVADFRAVLGGFDVRSRIFYPHKVNQAATFAAEAYRLGLDIDVCSPGEMESAVRAGFEPHQVEATGPKGLAFLQTLVANGVTVNVDNLWELDQLARGSVRLPVVVRLSGFEPPAAHRPPSRFGVDLADVPAALDILCRPGSPLSMRGVAFHLDSGDGAERVRAIDASIAVLEAAYDRGLNPDVLDIGGGFRQAFSADPAAYDDYVHALADGLAGDGPALGWPGHSFGYRDFRGTPAFHKYGNAAAGTDLLHHVLSADLRGQTVAEVVRDMLLELWIEPGKALVDGAGLTIATVEFVKPLAGGRTMVALDIGRDTVTPLDQEVMLDPVVVYRQPDVSYRDESCAVFFGGALCLERDLVLRHQTWLPRLPLPGDRVVFVNTAAYQMDLSATTAAMRPLPPKVAVRQAADGGFTVEPDRT